MTHGSRSLFKTVIASLSPSLLSTVWQVTSNKVSLSWDFAGPVFAAGYAFAELLDLSVRS